jgi:hypothetical protein
MVEIASSEKIPVHFSTEDLESFRSAFGKNCIKNRLVAGLLFRFASRMTNRLGKWLLSG